MRLWLIEEINHDRPLFSNVASTGCVKNPLGKATGLRLEMYVRKKFQNFRLGHWLRAAIRFWKSPKILPASRIDEKCQSVAMWDSRRRR
jgi:hypothetical protein